MAQAATWHYMMTCATCIRFVWPQPNDGQNSLGKCEFGTRKRYPMLWAGTPACKKYEEESNESDVDEIHA